ncbi:NAD(P)-dependent alcohol dehydrogenase [Tenggerimyces flavus]|uniref:NAD(P)-dependent alcohol dehydrogenase n=1 Tax=Tenggerimyces flavus TaxID=1708749 RepID=A0ABV7Y3A4_9ACTN|nr:NAD(P)-dependent alcohol dehydrogenase [Tenggerimyces flavus]MBM7790886.1 NADPH:quinone reductase-like Zn-dependent oxidoreductase [Tenggerimyces flavus]
MKAIVQDRYGSPDVLTFSDVDEPVPAANEVLVRVRASSVNAYDWHLMRGDPALARLASPAVFGLRAPKRRIRGRDVAGIVEAVGANVTQWKPGDEVYCDVGDANGAFAEYVCAPENLVATKPANLTFEQAAAVPIAANTALIGLRDVANVQIGQRLLINGATGGVGTYAVQLGKAFGAHVTAVCRTRNVELVRSLGADHVVDYTHEDFAKTRQRYDIVLDLVGNRSLTTLRSVATPEAAVVLSGGGTSKGGSLVGPMGLFLWAKLSARFVPQRLLEITVAPSGESLAELRELIEAGRVTPAIDRQYSLSEVPDAIRYVENEHARAKVVISV